jgi:hypothetical protein
MKKFYSKIILTVLILGIASAPIIQLNVSAIDMDSNENLIDAFNQVKALAYPILKDRTETIWAAWTAFFLHNEWIVYAYYPAYNAAETLNAALLRFKNSDIASIPSQVNGSFVYSEIGNALNPTPTPADLNAIFNGTGTPSFKSINETTGVNDISYESQMLILYGNKASDTEAFGGLLTVVTNELKDSYLAGYEYETGNKNISSLNGVGVFMSDISSAIPSTETVKKVQLENQYKASWAQLVAVNNWLQYMMSDWTANSPVIADSSNAEAKFYDQWVNHTDDFSLSFGLDVQSLVYNNSPYFPNMFFYFDDTLPDLTFDQCQDMWDPTNSSSITNATGIAKWLGAWHDNSLTWGGLNDTFDLTDSEMISIAKWISWFYSYGNQVGHGVPHTLAVGSSMYAGKYRNDPANIGDNLTNGMSTTDYVKSLFYTQWSDLNWYHGTREFDITTTYVVPPGSNDYPPYTGFEAALEGDPPSLLGLTWQETEKLFDQSNQSSFLTENGMDNLWIPAAADNTSAEFIQLNATFGLTTEQTQLIADWVVRWKYTYMPLFALRLVPHEGSIDATALDYFYQLWSSGGHLNMIKSYTAWLWPKGIYENVYDTLDINALDSDVPTDWYLDLSVSDMISYDTAAMLFHPYTAGSLASTNGIKVWQAILCNETVNNNDTAEYATLMDDFSLSTTQMDAILEWIPRFEAAFNITTDYCTVPPAAAPVIPGYDILVVSGFTGIAIIFIIRRKRKLNK